MLFNFGGARLTLDECHLTLGGRCSTLSRARLPFLEHDFSPYDIHMNIVGIFLCFLKSSILDNINNRFAEISYF